MSVILVLLVGVGELFGRGRHVGDTVSIPYFLQWQGAVSMRHWMMPWSSEQRDERRAVAKI